MIGVAAVGVGLAAYSAIEGANDKADAAQAQAASREAQAQETEYRAGRNASLISQEGTQVMGSQEAAFAAGGVELSGSALLALQSTQAKMNEDIYQTYHEARFRASQLRAGAQVDNQLAGDYQTTGFINAASALFRGAAGAYGGMGGGGKTVLGEPTPIAKGVGTNASSFTGLV